MQLEQQENFTIHGPQLEILGEVETKLPAPAKKRGTASSVLVALALVSVLVAAALLVRMRVFVKPDPQKMWVHRATENNQAK